MTYIIEQRFRYDYDAPVKSLRQRLVVIPPTRHGSQYCRGHLLEVSGAQARRSLRRDAHGNVVAWVRSESVAQTVEFRLAAVVERVRDDEPTLPGALLSSPRLLRPTRLTAADDRLRAMADDLTRHGDTPVEQAERISDAVHSAITYEYGVTSVKTTAAEALAIGRGVCQDFAHVMLACATSSGCLPGTCPAICSARAAPTPGLRWSCRRRAMVQRGSPRACVAFDPCNGRRAGNGYVTVATGRDYSDVAPTSGSYVGTACGTPHRPTAGWASCAARLTSADGQAGGADGQIAGIDYP